jgi:hypothetical protein
VCTNPWSSKPWRSGLAPSVRLYTYSNNLSFTHHSLLNTHPRNSLSKQCYNCLNVSEKKEKSCCCDAGIQRRKNTQQNL